MSHIMMHFHLSQMNQNIHMLFLQKKLRLKTDESNLASYLDEKGY